MDPAGIRTVAKGVRPGTPATQLGGAIGNPRDNDRGRCEEGTSGSELGISKQNRLSRNKNRETEQENLTQCGAFNIDHIGKNNIAMGPLHLGPSVCVSRSM